MILKFEDSNKMIVKTDKSSNIYKMSPKKYKQMLHKEVIKHHQKSPLNLINEFDKLAEILARKLKVEGRTEKYYIKMVLYHN